MSDKVPAEKGTPGLRGTGKTFVGRNCQKDPKGDGQKLRVERIKREDPIAREPGRAGRR